MSAMIGLGAIIFRLFGDRMRVMGRPLLVLETIGAKTGQARTTPLGWFPDTTDQNWVVVASYAGAARHPAWFLNMAKNPDKVWVKVGQRRFAVQPESLTGSDRARAWQRVLELSPGYGNYQRKTDREIPIVRLERIEEVG
jgi:deazaflavin-dependent oxidoreductase (nitroreductase family)